GRLHVQVVDGVSAQRQFGKDQQVHALLARLTDQPFVLHGVGGRVGDMDHRGRGGDAHEAVAARGVEGVRTVGNHQSIRSSRRTPRSSESHKHRPYGLRDQYRVAPRSQSTGSRRPPG
ncbi:hypothetical protein LTR94_027492, partial [Friedmanniomyces endolithicus]